MKIRNGFVSNSSSSSFIVQIKKMWKEEKDNTIATEEDIKKLKKYGFKKTKVRSPFNYKDCKKHKCVKNEEKHYMGYYLFCNQDEVAEFLIKNNIPFKASIHYDQKLFLYNRDDDNILIAQNPGHIIDMYGKKYWSNIYSSSEQPIVEKIPIKDYIKG